MKRLLIFSGFLIMLILAFCWFNRESKALYFARPSTSFGGFLGDAGLALFENSTYEAWTSGCFGRLPAEGEYSILNDTLYLSDVNNLTEGLEMYNLKQDSSLAFESCDTLIHDQFNFVISSIDKPR